MFSRDNFKRNTEVKKEVVLDSIPNSLQTADILTKALGGVLHERHYRYLFSCLIYEREREHYA